jgi:hypothetical protein
MRKANIPSHFPPRHKYFVQKLFSNTPSVYPPSSVRDQIKQLYKTTGKNNSFSYFNCHEEQAYEITAINVG